MGIVVKAENIGKKYTIKHQKRERYTTLRDTIMHRVRGIGQRVLHPLSPNREQVDLEEFWALKDINFEIEQGDRVGIIGRNGAGKSTLLKILSRITEPTTGKIRLKGRVSSLLEVGTGFHPELTGRENIYLNGAILGMTRAEIKKKFDEIVAFAELEKFLDTPVKHYSSGMYVRLAFAVAAHLEPEILIVDEVLAVGDAQFQKKCLWKMDEVAKEGRTVLFVSHNMATVQSLCERAILLEKGQIKCEGTVNAVVQEYVQMWAKNAHCLLRDRTDRRGNGKLKFTDIYFEDANRNRCPVAISGQELHIVCCFQINGFSSNNSNIIFSITIESLTGEKLLHFTSNYTGEMFENIPSVGASVCKIPRFPLIQDTYRITVCAKSAGEILDWVPSASEITVVAGDFFGTGKLQKCKFGPFLVDHSWNVCSIESSK